MTNSGDFLHIPATLQSPPRPPEDVLRQSPVDPLLNLSAVRARMDSLHRFLSVSVNNNSLIGKDQMEMVSTEISAAIRQIIVNGAALLASTAQIPPPKTNRSSAIDSATDLKFPVSLGDVEMKAPMDLRNSIGTKVVEMKVEDEVTKDEIIPSEDWDIIELDAVELLAEHIHFCDICGKGFKRDANLRMHMRAHGNQFKTPEALAKPERISSDSNRSKTTRFSCPFGGCNRNKSHKKFRPLKSVICVKNHFKRSHCPKMYSCNRCNKKSFSVVADLKNHLKHCGESKWKCSCGTTFSRKDKLFGHMAMFEGHMPAVVVEEEKKGKGAVAVAAMVEEEEEEDEDRMREDEAGENGFFQGLLDGFGSIEGFCLQDVLESPNGLGASMNDFFNF